MNVLIIKLGALGDVLRTTFVVRGIKEKYADARITWLTKKNAQEILANNHYIDTLVLWNKRMPLLNQEFDWVLSLDDEMEVCEFATQLHSKRFQGAYINDGKRQYTPDVDAWFGMGLLRPEEQGGKEKADELKALNRRTFQDIYAEMFDIQHVSTSRPILHLTCEELQYAEPLLSRINPLNIVIGINSGAGIRWELKMLSIEKTAEVCNALAKDLLRTILLLGGADEYDRNKKIKALCSHENILLIEPTKSINQFASIINLCDIVITADSLALHIAHALEKETIAFFGPTSPWEIDMFDMGAKVYKESDCLCCYKKTADKKPSCIERIMPEDIIIPCEEIIQKKQRR